MGGADPKHLWPTLGASTLGSADDRTPRHRELHRFQRPVHFQAANPLADPGQTGCGFTSRSS